jgi:hypothetical protein
MHSLLNSTLMNKKHEIYIYIRTPNNFQKLGGLLVLSTLYILLIEPSKEKNIYTYIQRIQLYGKIGSYHGCSSGIRKKMSDKAPSQTVRCYNKHIKGKQYEVC